MSRRLTDRWDDEYREMVRQWKISASFLAHASAPI
jgi:hypothetical protein